MIHAEDCQRIDDREQDEKRQLVGSVTELIAGFISSCGLWEERPGRLKACYAHAHELAISALTAKLN